MNFLIGFRDDLKERPMNKNEYSFYTTPIPEYIWEKFICEFRLYEIIWAMMDYADNIYLVSILRPPVYFDDYSGFTERELGLACKIFPEKISETAVKDIEPFAQRLRIHEFIDIREGHVKVACQNFRQLMDKYIQP